MNEYQVVIEAGIEAGIEAVQTVVDNWEHGDLAGAVNILEDWAVQAADYLPERDVIIEETLIWACGPCGHGKTKALDVYCAQRGLTWSFDNNAQIVINS